MALIVKKKFTVSDICSYLKKNDRLFIPSLQDRVNIHDFSKKIFDFAQQFWVLDDETIVGFMACYFNDPEKKLGYITTISVIEKYQNKGIGSTLLWKAISYAKKNNFKKLGLEVNKKNTKAIFLYEKNQFRKVKESESGFIMEKLIE